MQLLRKRSDGEINIGWKVWKVSRLDELSSATTKDEEDAQSELDVKLEVRPWRGFFGWHVILLKGVGWWLVGKKSSPDTQTGILCLLVCLFAVIIQQ